MMKGQDFFLQIIIIESNIKLYSQVDQALYYTKKNDPMCFHICSELYFYFTGRDAGNADQKQTFLKEPIQVKGKGILHVL